MGEYVSTNPYTTFRIPFRFDNGSVAKVGGKGDSIPSFPEVQRSINTGVRQLVMTEPGERVMLPNFGVGALKYVFSPLGSSLQSLLSLEVSDQLDIWEPRVRLSYFESKISVPSSMLSMSLRLGLTEFAGTTALAVNVGF